MTLPLLRKDFLFDPYQVYEARAFGASAILLIVAILSDEQLSELSGLARVLGMDCLVEVHDETELERALKSGVSLLGINNRDLRTFQTTIETSERLMRLVPADVTVVSESGLSRSEQLSRLEAQGVRAFLIGETFMAAPDPGVPLREMLRGSRVSVRVKICGITTITDAELAVQCGADLIGLNFYSLSPRFVSHSVARDDLCDPVPACPSCWRICQCAAQ